MPDEIRKILAAAPYLNGGLFTPNELDDEDKHNFALSDARFGQVFKFLERYNFTITEDSPLDQEVAVDPEMIGKVYESLVNVSAEADERGDAGIFYTPRTEIDLMCRLTLVDQLSNHVGDKHRNLFYELVFAIEFDEKTAADAAVAKAALWPAVIETLRNVTVVDPACGSGSFLVGMLYILDDLQKRAQAHGAAKESAFEWRKRIIGQNLYGVDVMDWACHVAELRLWLALVVDAQFSPAELATRKEPLLPHFTFKIRQGDSLVQEVGGVNLGRLHTSRDIKSALNARITALKNEKLKFYQNAPDRKYRTADQIRQEELRLFRDILDARVDAIEVEIKGNRQRLEGKAANLFGEQVATDAKLDSTKQRAALEVKTVELTAALDKARAARVALKTVQNLPFVWNIAFVEVFEDEKNGFDIVIGNPPYVRQENIVDPKLAREEAVVAEKKREYKDKLARAVYQAFPSFFGYNFGADRAVNKLDAKSDLYIYFHFIGLRLLNSSGTFSFICSSSWLDVGYGVDLQEFLLKHGHVKLVLDNESKRSFAQADVNTIIVLLGAPDDGHNNGLQSTARFVTFKAPFEMVLEAEIFKGIDSASARTSCAKWRVCVCSQQQLLDEGLAGLPGESAGIEGPKRPFVVSTRYEASKWGGKYLRAPEVYFTILEKGKDFLIQLGRIAEIRRGFTTGADDWFYLTKDKAAELEIEQRFLRPILTDPGDRNVPGILLKPANADLLVIDVHEDKAQIKGTALSAWIARGEREAIKGRGESHSIPAMRPSVANRKRWYELPSRAPSPILWIEVKKRRCFTLLNEAKLLADRSFYDISPNGVDAKLLCALLNTTLTALFCENQGNAPGGSGAGVQMPCVEVRRLPVFNPSRLSASQKTRLLAAFDEMCRRPIGPIYDEVKQVDRQALDSVLFEAIGLTAAESADLYTAVENLVRARLNKSKSLDTRETKKRQKAADSLRGIWAHLPADALKELME